MKQRAVFYSAESERRAKPLLREFRVDRCDEARIIRRYVGGKTRDHVAIAV